MKVTKTNLAGLLLIESKSFHDDRGYFFESFQEERYQQAGITEHFVQDNSSRSKKDVLRGLHYQRKHMQGKLIYVTRGAVLDVAVDIRQSSKTFGQWFSTELNDTNHRQLYIPPGFAHGFCVLSDETDFTYKCTDYYDPQSEITILWNDPAINIDWPEITPILSEKDQHGILLHTISKEDLPK